MSTILKNLAYGTEPLMVHAPGVDFPGAFYDLIEVLDEINPKWEPSEDLHIFTINVPPGRPEKPKEYLKDEAAKRGVEITVERGDGRSFILVDKIRLQLKQLRSTRAKYSLYADSNDAFLLASPKDILEKFLSLNVKVLFCPDYGFGLPPDPKYARFLLEKSDFSVFSGLNAGAVLGETETLISFLECCLEQTAQDPINDQSLVQKAWMEWDPVVKVDSTCQIIQNIHQYQASLQIQRPAWNHSKALLEEIKKIPKMDRILGAEIGVFDGRNASYLLKELPNLYLWLIDPYKEGESLGDHSCKRQEDFDRDKAKALRFTEYAWNRRVICEAQSIEAAGYCSDDSLDWAFIDSSHEYPHARQDVRSWWKKVRYFLAGHDYLYNSAVWGVKKAVDEFVKEKNLTLKVDEERDIWVIWK